jgi:hypothetical protein
MNTQTSSTAARTGKSNFVIDIKNECPLYAAFPKYWVKATQSIQGVRRLVKPDEILLIDPNCKPEQGQLVITCGIIEQYSNQPSIKGTAVLFSSSVDL